MTFIAQVCRYREHDHNRVANLGLLVTQYTSKNKKRTPRIRFWGQKNDQTIFHLETVLIEDLPTVNESRTQPSPDKIQSQQHFLELNVSLFRNSNIKY